MKRVISAFLVFAMLMVGCNLSVSAEPTDSFTHSAQPGGDYVAKQTRNMYSAVCTITASSLGLDESLEGLTDVCYDADGNVYILCGETSRLIVLNPDYTLKSEMQILDEDDEKLDFEGAQGVFVDESRNIYIADTNHARIVVINQAGKILRILGSPESNLIPEDFAFQPICVVRDDKDYTYILSQGCFYGALSYSPEMEFLGFYGPNTVNASALDTLSFLWDKLTGNDIKKAATVKKLPFSFADMSLDSDGYLVTCTGIVTYGENGKGQIRKISPGGSNILYQRDSYGNLVSSSSVNFLETGVIKRNGEALTQNISSVGVDKDGYIFALDSTYGLIYVYDAECNLLSTFGGGLETGNQLGVFHKAVTLDVYGLDLLVVDAEKLSLTVFRITEYGTLLRSAQDLYLKGDYEDAKPLWEQVLTQDYSNQMAFRGLAMAYYSENDYDTALKYARKGLDYAVYDMAWQAVLSGFMAQNFVWIAAVCLLLVSGLIVLLIASKKRKKAWIGNERIKIMLSVPFHPFRSFEEMNYKGLGSLPAALVLTALLFIAYTLQAVGSGFLYTDVSADNYNILYTLLQTVGLLLLWSVSNWLICSLYSGKGRLKEVFISTTYALIPLIAFTFLRVVLSYFLPRSGVGFLNGLQTAVWLFTFFLLCIAIMTVHEYDFFKFLLTGIITVLFMILIVFVLFLVIILLQQFWNFVVSLYMEVAYR